MAVYSADWSPDGQMIVSTSADPSLKIWDVATETELSTAAISGIGTCWRADGSRVAVAFSDGSVRDFDVATAKESAQFESHIPQAGAAILSPDQQRVAFICVDQTIKLWDARQVPPSMLLDEQSGPIASLRFSPDGESFATSGSDVRIWETASGRQLKSLSFPNETAVFSIDWSPDGKDLFSASTQKLGAILKLWSAESGEESHSWVGSIMPALAVDWSPNGQWLATAGATADKPAVLLWDAQTREAGPTLEGQPQGAFQYCVAWRPDSSRVAAGGNDNAVKMWDPATGKLLATLQGHSADVRSVVWSPDGRQLASASSDDTVRVWDAAAAKEILCLRGHSAPVLSVAWRGDIDPRHQRLASASQDKTVKIWDLTTGQETFTLSGSAGFSSVGWSPDGRRLAAGDMKGTIAIWDQLGETAPVAISAELLAEKLDDARQPGERQAIIARALETGLFKQLVSLRRNLIETQLMENPNDKALLARLTRAVLELAAGWTVLKPGRMESQGGATFKRLPDGSILVDGANPPHDVYSIDAAMPFERIAAIKFEVLPHGRLANRGPGRSETVNMILTDVALAIGGEQPSDPRRLPLALASADYSQAGFHVSRAIDEEEAATGWALSPNIGAAHAAVFSLAEAEQVPAAAVVTVKLAFESAWARHAAGRFRLSVADCANTAISDYVVAAIDGGELHGVAALGGAYFVYGDDRAAQRWLTLATENEDASPMEHFLLAMAQHHLNDMAAAQQSYQRAMAALDRLQVSEPLQALAQRAAVDIAGLVPEEAVATILQAQASAQLAALTVSIEQNPAAQEPYRARGHFFAGRARWKEAADDWRQVLRIAPETDFFWIERAALLAIEGDRAAYREHCRQMLDRFQDTPDSFTADKVVKACSLLPDAFDDMTALRELSQHRLTLDAGNPWHGVLQAAAALEDYRGGDLQAAEVHLKSVRAGSLSAPYQALYDAVSALVLYKLNDHAAARRHLDAASDLTRKNVPDFSRAEAFQLDWVIAEILRREAASLLETLDRC